MFRLTQKCVEFPSEERQSASDLLGEIMTALALVGLLYLAAAGMLVK